MLNFILMKKEVIVILKENIKMEKLMDMGNHFGKGSVHQFIRILKVYIKMMKNMKEKNMNIIN